jgi:hypothetical protein
VSRTSAIRRAAGFSLYEVVVGVFLLGVAVHPLVRTLAEDTRMATDRRDRLDAARLLRNEAALLAAADPSLLPAPRRYRADRSGRAAPDGVFEVTARSALRCVEDGPDGDPAAAPPGGCAGGAVVDHTVTVRLPRSAGAAAADTMVQAFSVPVRSPHDGVAGGTP